MAMKSLQSHFKLSVRKGVYKKGHIRNVSPSIYIAFISTGIYILTLRSGSFEEEKTGRVKDEFCFHFSSSWFCCFTNSMTSYITCVRKHKYITELLKHFLSRLKLFYTSI